MTLKVKCVVVRCNGHGKVEILTVEKYKNGK